MIPTILWIPSILMSVPDRLRVLFQESNPQALLLTYPKSACQWRAVLSAGLMTGTDSDSDLT